MKTSQIALITGATSGIGRSYAVYFAEAGYDLIITGRRMDILKSLAGSLRDQYNIKVHTVKAELTRQSDLSNLINIIQRQNDIRVLVNNAGYGSGVEFFKKGIGEHLQMLQVHVVVSLKLIYAVLPQMIQRRGGAIINVSSLGAYMPAPGSSMYSATKLFLNSFSESLHMEVHKYGIKVQCICPGFTRTEFHEKRHAGKISKASGVLWMEADIVVKKSLRSLQKKSIVYVPGIVNRLLVAISKLIPRRLYYLIMEKTLKA